MAALVAVLGALIAAVGAALILSPEWILAQLHDLPAKRRYYLAVGSRVVIGVVLIWASPETRAPLLVQILGVITLAAAFVVSLAGPVRLAALVDWGTGRSSALLRVWGGIGVLVGIWLVYVAL